ncbi:Protein of unknown function [Pyronema omphalodes CBS 100304]|uniref:Uncharacterized protein n=1 Tax=Pyronema omphalodes (strain CBS 100304) TaxID=1076935 RepID=U4LLD2_PYROM|nr:Protein of unknown function [Pyronema omphalodes CBS 100304]
MNPQPVVQSVVYYRYLYFQPVSKCNNSKQPRMQPQTPKMQRLSIEPLQRLPRVDHYLGRISSIPPLLFLQIYEFLSEPEIASSCPLTLTALQQPRQHNLPPLIVPKIRVFTNDSIRKCTEPSAPIFLRHILLNQRSNFLWCFYKRDQFRRGGMRASQSTLPRWWWNRRSLGVGH